MEKKVDETNEPSFILDDGIFDFGSLVLIKKDKRFVVQFLFSSFTFCPFLSLHRNYPLEYFIIFSLDRSHSAAVKFTLRNLTPIEAEVSLRFNDNNSNEFNIQPETLTIPVRYMSLLVFQYS